MPSYISYAPNQLNRSSYYYAHLLHKPPVSNGLPTAYQRDLRTFARFGADTAGTPNPWVAATPHPSGEQAATYGLAQYRQFMLNQRLAPGVTGTPAPTPAPAPVTQPAGNDPTAAVPTNQTPQIQYGGQPSYASPQAASVTPSSYGIPTGGYNANPLVPYSLQGSGSQYPSYSGLGTPNYNAVPPMPPGAMPKPVPIDPKDPNSSVQPPDVVGGKWSNDKGNQWVWTPDTPAGYQRAPVQYWNGNYNGIGTLPGYTNAQGFATKYGQIPPQYNINPLTGLPIPQPQYGGYGQQLVPF